MSRSIAAQYQRETGQNRPVRPRQQIVHIGVGGFHRAHLAWFQERLNRLDPANAWSIVGLGLLPEDRQRLSALDAQDGLYTLIQADQAGETPITIGSIRQVIPAVDQPGDALRALAAPETRIISTTVTEGGYLYDFERNTFLADHPQVQYDLENPERPRGLFGVLRRALNQRRESMAGPVTLMSCDNVPGNGDVFRSAFLAFLAAAGDLPLLEWVQNAVTFPNSMVDRITPVPPSGLPEHIASQYGVSDQCPVIAEPFAQWVLEDRFAAGRPAWERVGVELSERVADYEHLKIRLLNGTHVATAQVGYRLGLTYIHDLMNDRAIAALARHYMMDLAAPTITGFSIAEIAQYADNLVHRFSNPAVKDSVERVAADGFSRIKGFLLPVVRFHLARGQLPEPLAVSFACWLLKLSGRTEDGRPLTVYEPALSEAEIARFRSDPASWLSTPAFFGSQPDEPAAAFQARVLQLVDELKERPLTDILSARLATSTSYSAQ